MPFARILRSSALMGGAALVCLIFGFIRNKAITVFLGPSGIGVYGLLNEYANAIGSIFSLGMGSTIVRQIAAAEGAERPSHESASRRFAIKMAIIGLVAGALLAWPSCYLAFGNSANVSLYLIVSLSVPFMITSLAWVAVLQGRGQTKEIARSQILSGGLSLLLSVGLVYCFGITGVIISLVLVPALSCVMLYARGLQPARQAVQQDGSQGVLLKAGLALVGSIAVTQLASHATRIIIVQSTGLDHVGYYQAALGIAGSIPAFIFTAMAVDYYPRIAAASDPEEVLLLTNRQIQAGTLLATPIFAGLILWGGPLLHLFYSAEFRPAEVVQGWMIWGVACRLVSWPIGYWLLAKAPAREIFIIESASALMGPILTIFGLRLFGFAGVGAAQLVQAMLYGIVVLWVMRRKTGQGISAASKQAAGLAFIALGVAQMLVLMEAPASAKVCLAAGIAGVAGFIYYRKSAGHA